MKKKNENVVDFRSYIFETTGIRIEDLDARSEAEYDNPALKEAEKAIRDAANAGRKICIVGDYDADGIMAICIMANIMKRLGANWSMIVPKRFSEGYGLSDKIIDRLSDGCLLVTVDNGISAIGQVLEASNRGIDVVVIDHHEAGDFLPAAQVIADPKAVREKFSFHDYCGAGLAYKLATQMFEGDKEFLDSLSAFAAVATIADVVPLLGDNRNIVKRGLSALNDRKCAPGMAALADIMYGGIYESSDVAYKLAPAINAPGRLLDNGGEIPVKCMLLGANSASKMAESIRDYNNQRKDLTEKVLTDITPIGKKISFVYSPEIPEGLCGLIAGKLAESTHKPAFVVTDSENPDILKGSARATGEENIFKLMHAAKDKYITFGGHAAAAGFSFAKADLDEVIRLIDDVAKDISNETEETYDFDVLQDYLATEYNLFCNIKPFGEGLPAPLIRTRINVESSAYVGKDGNTLQLSCPGMRLVGFSMAEKYKALGEPKELSVYARYATNYYNGNQYPQMIIEDIEV